MGKLVPAAVISAASTFIAAVVVAVVAFAAAAEPIAVSGAVAVSAIFQT